MIKDFTRLFFSLTLLTVFGVLLAPHARAQTGPVLVQPTSFYRFQISSSDGGYLLTHFFLEGSANGHQLVPFTQPTADGLGIYRPPDGYTPDPSSGLVRLHRWRVVQSGWRVYYYYSIYFAPHGGDYHYEGVAGWVFPPGTQSALFPTLPFSLQLHPLSIWYSQDLGFWYGYGAFPGFPELPPNIPGKRNYVWQGVIAALPPACIEPFQPEPDLGCLYVVQFNPPAPPPPPPPPGTCNGVLPIENKCTNLAGYWDDPCTCMP